MTYRGHVANGQVVLDDPVQLEEGTRVQVEVISGSQLYEDAPEETLTQRWASIVGKAKGLPSDAAENHDHYLYGSTKK